MRTLYFATLINVGYQHFITKSEMNKKILLRERKRHTARRVASTPYVVLTGYPPILTWLGGYLTWVPPSRVPPRGYPPRVPPRGYPPGYPLPGYPPARVPPPGYPPSWTWQGTPPVAAPWHSWKCCKALWDMGTPPQWLPHGILGNVAKHYGIWVPPRCEQTNKVKLLPSRRTTYAGGNYSHN